MLLNRLMFIYFLQRKYFLDGGNTRYLQEKLEESKKRGRDRYYSDFLERSFLRRLRQARESSAVRLQENCSGKIKYLNGGLFLPHRVEMENAKIRVPDKAFENLFALFERYSWNLNDTPGGNDDEINPDVLGYIFEKYINQKEFGAYYTRPEITGYLCERTIYKLVLDKINAAVPPPPRQFASMPELLLNLDANLCRRPAPRGAAQPQPARSRVRLRRLPRRGHEDAHQHLLRHRRQDRIPPRPRPHRLARATRAAHPSLHYFIKKRIITDNLFGVDIMEEGAEIARLRLFLALVASAHSVEQLEPLPNIDFNILAGNSLIGLLKVDPQRFDAVSENKNAGRQGLIKLKHKGSTAELPDFAVETTVAPSKREKVAAFVAERNAGKFAAILADKNKSIELYRKHAFQPEEIDALDQDTTLVQLRSHIDNVRAESYAKLNQLLLDEFNALGIQFEQATWDDAKNKEGKPIKRPLTLSRHRSAEPIPLGLRVRPDHQRARRLRRDHHQPAVGGVSNQTKRSSCEDYSATGLEEEDDDRRFEKQFAEFLREPELRDRWLGFSKRLSAR